MKLMAIEAIKIIEKNTSYLYLSIIIKAKTYQPMCVLQICLIYSICPPKLLQGHFKGKFYLKFNINCLASL